MTEKAARGFRGAARRRLRLRDPGPRALPREHLRGSQRASAPSSGRSRSRSSPPSKLGLPKACLDLCWLSKGLVARHGPDRLRQVDHARGDDRLHQQEPRPITSSRSRIRSSSCTRTSKCLVNQREVGAAHEELQERAPRRAARGSGHRPRRRDARPRDDRDRDRDRRDGPPRLRHAAHDDGASSTVDRIIDQFPADRQAQIRVMLSESLKGVVAQVLCKKIGGGRVAAHEILLGTTAVANIIREGKTFQLPSVMQTGEGHRHGHDERLAPRSSSRRSSSSRRRRTSRRSTRTGSSRCSKPRTCPRSSNDGLVLNG